MTKFNVKKTGVFFDGYHTLLGLRDLLNQHIFNLNFSAVEKKLRGFLEKDTNAAYNIVYQGWFQGIRKSYLPSDKANQLDTFDIARLKSIILRYHNDRILHWALIEAGIEPIWLHASKNKTGKLKEKGVDTALVISVLRRVELFNLDAIIVFTNDKDYEPLFHNIRKSGISIFIIDCSPQLNPDSSPFRFIDRSYHYKTIFNNIPELLKNNEK
jgi:uncharacterized LabA/DUF88 family protein